MAEKDVEIHRLLSEARVKSLEFARKQRKPQPTIERARAWMKYYEKKSEKTKQKKDLAMLEYWRNELASWQALQKIRSSAAKYRRTHENADLLKMRTAQAEYYEKRVTISPPEEAERIKKRLTQLQSLIVQQKTLKHKYNPIGIVGYVLLLIGASSLILSILYTSSILAFTGLGLTFWGALLLFMKQERYVKSKLLDPTAISSLQNLSKITTELNYKGKAVYLPPKYLKDFKSGVVYISKKEENKIPPPEEIHEEKLFSKNPQGICITPPGLNLTNLYEKETGTDFIRADLKYLQNNLPKLFIETLEIAQDLEINTENNLVNVKITDSVYKNFCKQSQKLSNICNSIGCPLCSSLAIALTRTTGKPITIEKTQPSQDGKTIQAHYRIIEE